MLVHYFVLSFFCPRYSPRRRFFRGSKIGVKTRGYSRRRLRVNTLFLIIFPRQLWWATGRADLEDVSSGVVAIFTRGDDGAWPPTPLARRGAALSANKALEAASKSALKWKPTSSFAECREFNLHQREVWEILVLTSCSLWPGMLRSIR